MGPIVRLMSQTKQADRMDQERERWQMDEWVSQSNEVGVIVSDTNGMEGDVMLLM